MKSFKDLIVWQKSHGLVLKVYKLTKFFPRDELFALVSQIRRAAVSVPANIVEGFRRRTLNDSIHFYYISSASLEELKYHLFLARDLKYISSKEYEAIELDSEEVSKLLNGWIKSQKLISDR